MRVTIQIVAGDSYLAGIYGRKFEEGGYKVQILESLDEALRKATRSKPRAILLDIDDLPDAPAAFKKIRAHASLQDTKLVLLGTVSDWAAVQNLKSLADAYLIHGQFVPREAVEKINHLLSI